MSGPWEQYQKPAAEEPKPWEQFGGARPIDDAPKNTYATAQEASEAQKAGRVDPGRSISVGGQVQIPGTNLDVLAQQQQKRANQRDVGFLESAGRTAGAAAIPVVRTLGLASGAIAGILGEKARDSVFQGVDSVLQSMRGMYAPKEGEEFSTAGSLAGGVLSTPIQVAGGLGVQHGIERAAEVAERGGTMSQAAQAGVASGAANVALNLLPVKAGGAVGRALESRIGGMLGGAATGGAIAAGGGTAARAVENSALPQGEQFNELRQEVAPSAAEVGMGAVLGAVPGAAGAARRVVPKAVAKVADRALAAATPEMSDQKLALAGKAIDTGIPLNVHQVTDSKIAKLAGEMAEHIPYSGSKKPDRIDAFNNGLARAMDPESKATRLTSDVFAELQNKAGEKIGEISERTPVPAEAFGDIHDVARRETPDVQQVIAAYAKDFARVAEENGGVIPGTQLRKLRTEAQTQMRGTSNGDLRRTLGDLVKKIDDGLTEHAADGDMDALIDARRRYAISITLEPLVAKAADGKISPATLMGAVSGTKQGKHRMATGRAGDLGDYARIGQEFLKDPGSSNTTERNIVYKVLTDGLAAAKVGVTYFPALAYNTLGPKVLERMVKAEQRRRGEGGAEPPAAPPEPGLSQGFEPPPQRPPEGGPLGDLTPDWETAPGAAPERPPMETVPTEGLVPAVGDQEPNTGFRRAPLEMEAVPGRPDLPDVMVAGAPSEVAATEATGRAMQTPEASLARRQQEAARAPAPAEPVDPRLAKLDEAHAQADSDVVRKVVQDKRKAVEKAIEAEKTEAKRVEDIGALEKAAKSTDDPELRAEFQKKADALRAEKIPVDEATEVHEPPATGRAPETAKKLPVGKATEVHEPPATGRAPDLEKPLPVGEAKEVTHSGVETQEKIPVGEAKELLPPGERHDLGLPSIDESFMQQEFDRAVTAKPEAPTPGGSDRGVKAVRKALTEASEAGHIDKDGAALALWALDRNPGLAKGLRPSIEPPRMGTMAKGSYNPAEQIVRLFKGLDNPHTAAHEILHHAERMMPTEVKRGIRKEWSRALQQTMQKSRGKERELLAKIPEAIKGDAKAWGEIMDGFKSGALKREEHYQLVNPSEFWAVNGPRILQERFVGRGSWRAEARRWLNEMIEHVKGSVGLRSDAPILKALDDLLNSEKTTGARRTKTDLTGKRTSPDITTGE